MNYFPERQRLHFSQWCDACTQSWMDASDGGCLCFGWVTLWEKTSCGPTRGCLWSYSYVTETQTFVGSQQCEEVLSPRVIFSIFVHLAAEIQPSRLLVLISDRTLNNFISVILSCIQISVWDTLCYPWKQLIINYINLKSPWISNLYILYNYKVEFQILFALVSFSKIFSLIRLNYLLVM